MSAIEKEGTLGGGTGLNGISPSDTEVQDFWDFIVHLTIDTAKNLVLLVALSVIFFFARWLERLGMDEADIRHIQQLHFWMTYAVLVWIGIVFFVKLIRRSLK